MESPAGADAYYLLGPSQWHSSLNYQDSFFGTASEYATKYTERFLDSAPFIAAQSSAAGKVATTKHLSSHILPFSSVPLKARVLQLGIESATNYTSHSAVATAIRGLGRIQTFYGPIGTSYQTLLIPGDGLSTSYSYSLLLCLYHLRV